MNKETKTASEMLNDARTTSQLKSVVDRVKKMMAKMPEDIRLIDALNNNIIKMSRKDNNGY